MNWIELQGGRAEKLIAGIPRGIRSLPGFFILLILFLSSYSLHNTSLARKGGGGISVVIPPGFTLRKIEERLIENGVLNNPRGFTLLAKVMGVEKRLKAGRYRFWEDSSKFLILEILSKGMIEPFRITIPVGIRIERISEILEKELGIEKNKILNLLKDGNFARELGFSAEGLEGYLFPDTYEFVFETNLEEVVKVMPRRLLEVFDDEARNRSKEMGLNLHEVLTMASMIEKEIILQSEGPIIGGVLYNRLKLNMPLQCDATVQYALPQWKSRLTYKDLKVNSPYNTYLHRGLPPGPICNPSQASIHAALFPDSVDFLYYVATPKGSHIFSRTHTEHIRAKRRAKKEWAQLMKN
ncbi:endolytic transglycosylase MltG [candidate division TA06 bacterium]|nr:endolytic transglycosylase MltG [candidate division TA06 bacterium]